MLHLNRRSFAIAVSAALLWGCTDGPGGIKEAGEPIGAFKLGHNIVVADNVQKVDPSKNVTVDEWETALKASVDRRFSAYTGDQFYHIAINVLAYSIAVPGVPVVLSPKSVMVMEATVWDDAKQGKINEEPKQFWVYESVDADTVVGSGLTKSPEEVVANLSYNAAKQIEEWMRENPDWFAPRD